MPSIMTYIAIDTCVWLELLKTEFNHENNQFDELLFWIENNHITLLTTENLIDEWNRHKISKKDKVISAFKIKQSELNSLMSAPNPMNEFYKPERVRQKLEERIVRIDAILGLKAEKAMHTDAIFIEASKRNLACIAPNHKKDSFRDTVNILTLKEYIKQQGYQNCIFTTINYTDYGDKDPYKVHPGLKSDFGLWSIEYVYFDDKTDSFSGKLFKVHLKPHLPSYEDFIKEQKRNEKASRTALKKIESEAVADNGDPNYLDYIMQIDAIIAKNGKINKLDENNLEFLFAENQVYQDYFYKKL